MVKKSQRFLVREINYGTYGIVDKVIVTETTEGLRKCKVRIRKEKIQSGIGDRKVALWSKRNVWYGSSKLGNAIY